MPLTEKGNEIMSSMKEEYGEKKGKEVFYASKNAGTISGVDSIAQATDCDAPPDFGVVMPIHDAVLNWGNGELEFSSGGEGASASHSRSIGAVSGVDAISQFDGSE